MGDKNTKFFHATTLCRRNWNRIDCLQKFDNSWVHSRNEISHELTNYFQDILSADTSIPTVIPNHFFARVITKSNNIALESTPSHSEIFQAISSIGGLKAPGPDGFPVIFFQKDWNLLHTNISTMITNFFTQAYSLSHINQTNMALIP